jgi:uncharacterized protein YjiS (DUF1127 family)
MSRIFRTPAAAGGCGRTGSSLIATVKTWWMVYCSRCIERVAIVQLEAMRDRQLEDLALHALRSSAR